MSVSIDQALDHDAPLPIPGECNSIGEAVGSYVAWPSHLIKPKVKKPGKKKMLYEDLPSIDVSSVPKPLHMLYCYAKLVIQNRGNVEIEFDHGVFGREFKTFVNIEDMVPFCQLEPISYVCVVVYMWHLYRRLVRENKVQNFRFVDPYEIGHLPSTKGDQNFRDTEMERRARALAKRLSGTLPSQLVLAPCNVGYHWILTVINPHKETVHLLDPLYHRMHDQTWKKIVDLAMRIFNMEIGKNGKKQPTWEVVKAPLQPDSKQCGFFVLRYMRQLLDGDVTANMDSLRSIFEHLKCTRADIDEVRVEWAECIQDHIKG